MRKLLKPKAAAEILDVPLPRFYFLARNNKIPVVRMGKQIRVDPEQLHLWIKQGGEIQSDTEQGK